MKALKLTAPCKDYLWGGTKLKTEYGKRTSLEKVAESWELSCHKDGCSTIAGGPEEGRTLPEYLAEHPEALGGDCARFASFPILIKLIDAKDNLSVQVHPADEYALRVEGEYGKTEMWYVVECEPGAELIYGFRRELSREEFERRIRENDLDEVVNRVPVRRGDMFFIEPGTLHAIGSGILIAEIQQNSNTTYRVYDYGRLGADGKPRELHIEKALDVTRLAPPTRPVGPQGAPEDQEGAVVTLLASCGFFTVRRVERKPAGRAAFEADDRSFHSILCLSGSGELTCADGALAFQKGDSLFIPAGTGAYQVKGACEFLLTTV